MSKHPGIAARPLPQDAEKGVLFTDLPPVVGLDE